MSDQKAVVGNFHAHTQAYAAAKELQKEGFERSDKFPVLAHGTAEDVAKARSILKTAVREELVVHQ